MLFSRESIFNISLCRWAALNWLLPSCYSVSPHILACGFNRNVFLSIWNTNSIRTISRQGTTRVPVRIGDRGLEREWDDSTHTIHHVSVWGAEWEKLVAFAAPGSVEPINLAISAMSAMPFTPLALTIWSVSAEDPCPSICFGICARSRSKVSQLCFPLPKPPEPTLQML